MSSDAPEWNARYLDAKRRQSRPEMLVACLKVVELAPQFGKGRRRLGFLLVDAGRFQEGEAQLLAALRILGPDPLLLLTLARCAVETERHGSAAAYLEQFRALYPITSAYDELAQRIVSQPQHVARYPRYAAQFDDLDRVIQETVLPGVMITAPLFDSTSQIVTLGSCFAGNLAKSLEAHGIHAYCFGMAEDFNSTFANVALFQYLAGANPEKLPYSVVKLAKPHADVMRDRLRHAAVLVYTVGVAPCFFDRSTHELVIAGADASVLRRRRDTLIARTTTVEENTRNLLEIIELARTFNPSLKIVYTLSPVPLIASFEQPSAVMADCLSKSVLRVACHQIAQMQLPNVYYWPSFEIVRWLGAHTGPVFGADGNAHHVDQSVVDRIMKHFLAVALEPTASPFGPRGASS
jgi:hypothetical protein